MVAEFLSLPHHIIHLRRKMRKSSWRILFRTGRSQVGDLTWAKNQLMCTWQSGCFYCAGLKQTENYTVHKRIFHIAELCKVFTLEFLFLNSLSQAALGLESQGSWAENVSSYYLRLVGIACKVCGVWSQLCSLQILGQHTLPLILNVQLYIRY